MLEQPAQEMELTAEQRRNLGHIYRMILGWRRERKIKTASQTVFESLPEEQRSLRTKSDSVEQMESES